ECKCRYCSWCSSLCIACKATRYRYRCTRYFKRWRTNRNSYNRGNLHHDGRWNDLWCHDPESEGSNERAARKCAGRDDCEWHIFRNERCKNIFWYCSFLSRKRLCKLCEIFHNEQYNCCDNF